MVYCTIERVNIDSMYCTFEILSRETILSGDFDIFAIFHIFGISSQIDVWGYETQFSDLRKDACGYHYYIVKPSRG